MNGTGTKSGSNTPVVNIGAVSNGHLKGDAGVGKGNKKTAKIPTSKSNGLVNGAANHGEVTSNWKHWFPGSKR